MILKVSVEGEKMSLSFHQYLCVSLPSYSLSPQSLIRSAAIDCFSNGILTIIRLNYNDPTGKMELLQQKEESRYIKVKRLYMCVCVRYIDQTYG